MGLFVDDQICENEWGIFGHETIDGVGKKAQCAEAVHLPDPDIQTLVFQAKGFSFCIPPFVETLVWKSTKKRKSPLVGGEGVRSAGANHIDYVVPVQLRVASVVPVVFQADLLNRISADLLHGIQHCLDIFAD